MKRNINQRSYNLLLKKAARLVVLHQNASSSFLQRQLDIGYKITAQILEKLETMGVISEYRGSEPRIIYVKYNESLKTNLEQLLTPQLVLKSKKKKAKSIDIFPPSNRI